MERNQRIVQNIAHVDLGALLPHLRVLLHHQPADVGEEEPSPGVVGISRGLGELVVDTVVADPFVDCVLWVFGHLIVEQD